MKQQARHNQIEPEGNWKTWLILSGRGWGKTRTGAEWLAWQAIHQPKTRWAVLAPTYADARDTCVEGDSGLLKVLRDYGALRESNGWNRSIGELFLANGSRIKLFSADEPERLRGPQFHGAWLDELAAFKYPEAYDQLQFGLRLGQDPRAVITTTPRPKPLVRSLIAREDGTVHITRGATFDNAANLAPAALIELQARYSGTRLGRQELYGELLEDIEGALWTQQNLDECRVVEAPKDMQRVVIAIDPAVTMNENSDETGIVVAGKNSKGEAFIIADYSIKASPLDWAKRAVEAYRTHNADAIVVEVNNGGDMIPAVIKQVDASVFVKQVRATRGKQLRAEPIAAFYEQGRVHHVGVLDKLEMQMTTWTPEDPKSPDRLDALVWACTDLLDNSNLTGYLSNLAVWCDNCSLPMPKNAQACSKCGASLTESEAPRHPLGV
jgi:phage terminase large subunit-like protein